jgi:hypothetical protein
MESSELAEEASAPAVVTKKPDLLEPVLLDWFLVFPELTLSPMAGLLVHSELMWPI